MSRTSIKRLLRDSIKAHLIEQDAGADLDGVQVVVAFDGDTLTTKHIRIVTESSEPQIAGVNNLGRWDITATISVVTEIDDYTGDEHDDLVGLIEDYILQGNATLAAGFTTSEIKVDNVMPASASELAIEGMRYSQQAITCECYKL
jgi:hypothetical protein